MFIGRRRSGESGASQSFVAVLIAVGVFALAGIAATTLPSVAIAADDPVPTAPDPEPDPTPDPFTPAPAPKPKPAPTPAPAPRSQPSPAPAPVVTQRPTAPTPTVVPSHATVTKHESKPKRKKKAHRKTVHKKAKPIPVASKAAQVAVPVKRTVAIVSPSKPFDSGMFVLLGMIGLAFVCLAVAAIPATYVRWRPAAYFVARRNLDLAIVGLALLLLAGVTFLVTGGS